MYLLMCIGCIECGVSSAIVGTFDSEADAEAHAARLNNSPEFNWREGGQNHYEVFELPAYHNAIAAEFAE